MELRKFLMEELKKASTALSKYEDAYIGMTGGSDAEFLKTSIEYYRAQVTELRKQIYETRTQP